MIDWLNTKAALSIAVMALIACAGAWYEYHEDTLTRTELEAVLENFVDIIDRVCTGPYSITVNITFSEDADGDFGSDIPARVNGKYYDIILTADRAKFVLANIDISKRFGSSVHLYTDPVGLPTAGFDPGVLDNCTGILKFTSSAGLLINKSFYLSDTGYRSIVIVALFDTGH